MMSCRPAAPRTAPYTNVGMSTDKIAKMRSDYLYLLSTSSLKLNRFVNCRTFVLESYVVWPTEIGVPGVPVAARFSEGDSAALYEACTRTPAAVHYMYFKGQVPPFKVFFYQALQAHPDAVATIAERAPAVRVEVRWARIKLLACCLADWLWLAGWLARWMAARLAAWPICWLWNLRLCALGSYAEQQHG